jgi:SlyX protein
MSQSSPQSDSAGHDPAARVSDLEEKIMFQQRGLDELNEVVLRQQSELDQLRREVQSLRTLAERATEQDGAEDLPHEKPPHY